MRTEQLYYALAVSKTNSFSKASELLLIKQQSVRMAINNLEEELGVKLFERTNKGVFLTAEGKTCMAEFAQILLIYENIKYRKYEEKQKLTIGVNQVGNLFLSSIFEEFTEKYENIKIKITEEDSSIRLINGLKENQYDFVITTVAENILKNYDLLHRTSKDATFRTLETVAVGVALHQLHPLAKKKVISIEELSQYPIVSFNKNFFDDYLKNITKGKWEFNEIISSNETIHRYYLKHEQAISILPLHIAERFKDKEIIAVPLKENIPLHFGLLYQQEISSDERLMGILDYLEEIYKKREKEVYF